MDEQVVSHPSVSVKNFNINDGISRSSTVDIDASNLKFTNESSSQQVSTKRTVHMDLSGDNSGDNDMAVIDTVESQQQKAQYSNKSGALLNESSQMQSSKSRSSAAKDPYPPNLSKKISKKIVEDFNTACTTQESITTTVPLLDSIELQSIFQGCGVNLDTDSMSDFRPLLALVRKSLKVIIFFPIDTKNIHII